MALWGEFECEGGIGAVRPPSPRPHPTRANTKEERGEVATRRCLAQRVGGRGVKSYHIECTTMLLECTTMLLEFSCIVLESCAASTTTRDFGAYLCYLRVVISRISRCFHGHAMRTTRALQEAPAALPYYPIFLRKMWLLWLAKLCSQRSAGNPDFFFQRNPLLPGRSPF